MRAEPILATCTVCNTINLLYQNIVFIQKKATNKITENLPVHSFVYNLRGCGNDVGELRG